jgi:DNA mismatch endonuclease, patch repair protein
MDVFSTAKRSEIMSHVRGANTKPERRVRSILHRLGYRFRLHKKELPGTPDIVLRARRSVIFVHGCFWHRHKGCGDASMPRTRISFWKTKLSDNVMRDARTMSALRRMGWRCLVIWECELRQEGVVVRKLRAFLK